MPTVNLETKVVTLTTKHCDPTVPGKKPCPKCLGTGNGPRGGHRACKKCYGFGTISDHENRVTCSRCKGTAEVPEGQTDYMSVPDTLPLKFGFARALPQMMSLIGSGSIYTTIDYGRLHGQLGEVGTPAGDERANAELAKIRQNIGTVQACKVVRFDDRSSRTGKLCDNILVVVTPNSYALIPQWDKDTA